MLGSSLWASAMLLSTGAIAFEAGDAFTITEACDPALLEASQESSEKASEKLSSILSEVIGTPMNIEELACLDNMFSMDFGLGVSIPGIDDIMNAVLSNVCSAAEEAWGEMNDRLSKSLAINTDDFELPGGVRVPGLSGNIGTGLDRNPNASQSDILKGNGSASDIINMDIPSAEDLGAETYENSSRAIELMKEALK